MTTVATGPAPHRNAPYTTVPNAGMVDWEHAYWGANVPRLREIKAKYPRGDV